MCEVACAYIFTSFFVQRMNLKTGQETSEEVTLPVVYEEFKNIAEKHKIDEFRSMVKKNFQYFTLTMLVVILDTNFAGILSSIDTAQPMILVL